MCSHATPHASIFGNLIVLLSVFLIPHTSTTCNTLRFGTDIADIQPYTLISSLHCYLTAPCNPHACLPTQTSWPSLWGACYLQVSTPVPDLLQCMVLT
jgi:hypothetical protein